MKPKSVDMRIELNTDHDMQMVDFLRGTICAVCKQPIGGPPALWLGANSMDFFLHQHCEPSFTPEIIQQSLGDLVLAMQDRTLHDTPPERN